METRTGSDTNLIFIPREQVVPVIRPRFHWTRGGRVVFRSDGRRDSSVPIGTLSTGVDDGMLVDPRNPHLNGELYLYDGGRKHEADLRRVFSEAIKVILNSSDQVVAPTERSFIDEIMRLVAESTRRRCAL